MYFPEFSGMGLLSDVAIKRSGPFCCVSEHVFLSLSLNEGVGLSSGASLGSGVGARKLRELTVERENTGSSRIGRLHCLDRINGSYRPSDGDRRSGGVIRPEDTHSHPHIHL